MAVVPICYKMPYKDCSLPTQNAVKQQERNMNGDCVAFPKGSRSFVSISNDAHQRSQSLYPVYDSTAKPKMRVTVNASQGEDICDVWYSVHSNANEKQLRLLDSYLGKVQGNRRQPSSESSTLTAELPKGRDQINAKEELEHLNDYLGKVNRGTKKNQMSYAFNEQKRPFSDVVSNSRSENDKEMKSFTDLGDKDVDEASMGPQALQQSVEASDLYLINILASVNIAVFLFEIASPVKNSEFELFTLPLLYGAKINDLILVGEWWRLITPMFLHSGVCHIALGCWSLITFGPPVCRAYGSFTFFLIYLLGGISGNLTSFLHTPEPTVGGTGPVFAIMGAWLVYQLQNKDLISKDDADSMFDKAIITTGVSFILSHFGPIDDWTHLGAAFTGIIYGFFTCPTLQLDDASPRIGREEGITLVRRYADPCKSFILFTLFIAFLSSLLFVLQPPLETLVLDGFE